MSSSSPRQVVLDSTRFGCAEFVALMSWLMAMTALSVDIMLPALPAIGAELGAATANDRQLVVLTYLLGLALGQLVWGPLSDGVGRRGPLLAGLAVYVAAGVAAIFAPSFELLLAARALQGLGGAAARAIGMAIVRDTFQGRPMARVMSFIVTILMIVPVIAPALGQVVLLFAHWRSLFVVLLAAGLVVLAWAAARLPETRRIPVDEQGHRIPLPSLATGLKAVLGHRISVGYMLASGFMFSALVAYIASSQQVFVDVYHLGEQFPLAFACIAGCMSLASLVNAQLVQRLGMRRLAHTAILAFAAVGLALTSLSLHGQPPFVVTAAALAGSFFLFGLSMPNLQAISMQPVGHVAGLASSLMGAYSTAIGTVLGGFIGQSFDGSTLPLALGFASLGICAFLVVLAAEGWRGMFRGE